MIGMTGAATDQHLTELVLVRYSHTYGGPDGLSNHLKILNRVLLQRGSITIYQIYPSLEGADQTSSQPHNIDSDTLVEIPLRVDRNSRLRQKLSRARDYHFRIKRSLLNVHPYAWRLISRLRGLFFRLGWFWMGRFVPFLSADSRIRSGVNGTTGLGISQNSQRSPGSKNTVLRSFTLRTVFVDAEAGI